MAIKDVLKISRKTFFAPSDWVGLDTLKTQTSYLRNLFSGIMGTVFGLRKATTIHETFAAAMQRARVTEADLQEKQQSYLLYATVFVILAILILIIGITFLLKAHFLACVISLTITLLMLSQAFRYHFWQFQIKYRKLGCTFEEWRRGTPD